MAPWGYIAGVYGVLMILAALGATGAVRRPVPLVAAIAYTLVGFGAATADIFWVHLLVPGALLLLGYWLSGFFFRDPQPWLERWLLASDRWTFATFRLDEGLRAAPQWALELLEASYTADYIVVAAGAILSATFGTDAVVRYWALVLGAELACYAALPFLRSRPPRALEAPGVIAERAPLMRRLNAVILDRASVQANTLPSGHVAGAVAAALAVMPLNATVGWVFLGMSVLIALSASAGRYHYVVDCVLGAVVAVAAALAVF